MEPHIKMRLLILWCIAIHVVDCWTTFQLANYYGWEGELNLIVKSFISTSVYHMIFLKFIVITPLLYLWNALWDDNEYLDIRHTWAVYILFTYNCFAAGAIIGNVLLVLTIIS